MITRPFETKHVLVMFAFVQLVNQIEQRQSLGSSDCKAQRPTPSNGITQPNMKVYTIKASLDHKEKEKM